MSTADTSRPHRHLCREADQRDAMSDDEFWDHAFPQSDVEESGPDVVALTVEPCPVCGEQGACAYDAEGRPLIHTDTELTS